MKGDRDAVIELKVYSQNIWREETYTFGTDSPYSQVCLVFLGKEVKEAIFKDRAGETVRLKRNNLIAIEKTLLQICKLEEGEIE